MRSAVLLSLIPLAAALPHVERASNSSSGSSSSSSSLASLAKKAGKLYFGTEASSYYFATKNYSAIEKAQFNQITPENEMKWEVIEPTRGNFNWTGSDLLMSVAKETKSYFRGHNFCWDSQNPPYVQNITTSAEALDILKEHIDAVMGRYGKDFYAFDVINEPVNENGTYKANPWYNALGESYIETALRYAHAAAPNVKLYINDYNIEGINNKSTALLGWVKALKAKGAPIHGVGFESHFIAGSMDPTIKANMKRFTDAGVDVAITELDIRTPVANDGTANSTWLSIQAADYANITSICVNNSGCPGITVWGFNDYFSWIPGVFAGMGAADLYDLKYQPKPALAAVRSALSK